MTLDLGRNWAVIYFIFSAAISKPREDFLSVSEEGDCLSVQDNRAHLVFLFPKGTI